MPAARHQSNSRSLAATTRAATVGRRVGMVATAMIEMAAMQVDRHDGRPWDDRALRFISRLRSSGLTDVFSSLRWSIPKRSASQSASTSWPMVGLSCWQCSAPVSSGSSDAQRHVDALRLRIIVGLARRRHRQHVVAAVQRSRYGQRMCSRCPSSVNGFMHLVRLLHRCCAEHPRMCMARPKSSPLRPTCRAPTRSRRAKWRRRAACS